MESNYIVIDETLRLDKGYSFIHSVSVFVSVSVSVCLSACLSVCLCLSFKLQLFGTSERSLGWFFSYWDDRQQECYVDGKLSDSCTIRCRVLQGSILGPLLFLIYINDFPTCLKYSKARTYADDTTISVAGITAAQVEILMNADQISIKKWLESNT